jgi:hypothetical protein
MKFLKRVWGDIERGENIDLYVTVFIAVGLVILNLFGTTPDTWIAPITLAVLGLLAISVLGNRYRVEEVLQKLKQSNTAFFFKGFPPSLETDFEAAQELWLVGATLSKTITTKYRLIEEKLRQGCTLKILLIHPEGASLEIMASRYYAPQNRLLGVQASNIKNSLQLFCDLQKVAPENIEIRTVRNSLAFGATAIDPNSSTGILYLEHYPFRTVSASLPKFILKASDGEWYDFFKREIQTLWDAGETWGSEDSS